MTEKAARSVPSFDLSAVPDVIPVGQRREAIFRKASSCRSLGYRFEDAWSITRDWWSRCEQRPGEAFAIEDAQAQVIDVFTRYDPPEVPDPPRSLLRRRARVAQRWRRATGPVPELLRRSDAKFLVYRGMVNSLVGDSEAGKTWVALACVAEVLNDGGSVLVIDVDHNTTLAIVDRLMRFGVPKHVLTDQSRFRYTDAEEKLRCSRWSRKRGRGGQTWPSWTRWAR